MAIRVTFLIGNGFDLNLDLKTRYQDFYPHYLWDNRFRTDDPDIFRFKELLRNGSQYPHWADFELALGQHTNTPPLNTAVSLRKCLQHFKRCFAQYLQDEEARIDYDACGRTMALQFLEDIRNHLSYLEPRFRNNILNAHSTRDLRLYRILNFNYTTVIDRLFGYLKDENFAPQTRIPVIHIHGTHSGGMILGVDNADQVANPTLFTNDRQWRMVIKPLLNQQSGYGHDEEALSVLENSSTICIFGMSLGETDSTWWVRIGRWLLASSSHHLLIFSRGSNLDSFFPEDILDYQDNIRDLFFSRTEISPEEYSILQDRVHIAITSNIFKLEPVMKAPPAEAPLPPGFIHVSLPTTIPSKGAPL